MMNTHDTRIVELSTKVDHRVKEVVNPVESKKEKGKGAKNEFYYVNIYNTIIVYYIFMPFLTNNRITGNDKKFIP